MASLNLFIYLPDGPYSDLQHKIKRFWSTKNASALRRDSEVAIIA